MPKRSALRALYEKRDGIKTEEREIHQADRARRLGAFFNSEVWEVDILPLMRRLYDDYLEEVKEHKVDPDVLKVLDDLLVRLGGSIQVGVGAMERIAAKRLGAVEQIEELKQRAPDVTY